MLLATPLYNTLEHRPLAIVDDLKGLTLCFCDYGFYTQCTSEAADNPRQYGAKGFTPKNGAVILSIQHLESALDGNSCFRKGKSYTGDSINTRGCVW